VTTLTKRYGFAASHRLCAPSLSEQRNREIFGKCANPFGHGHNYSLEVSIQGEPDPRSGMVAQRSALDRWVQAAVIRRVDHTHLNSEIAEFGELVPTSENLLVVIEGWLRTAWPDYFPGQPMCLASLRLEETPRNSFRSVPANTTVLQ
jgi:6-pyruvoyltetrahydropterin/6-carboxytetrahydropterin synthase